MIVSKWGNSLAVRLPVSLVKTLNLKEGDELDMSIINLDDSGISVELAKKQTITESFHKQLKRFKSLPSDFAFNREDANER